MVGYEPRARGNFLQAAQPAWLRHPSLRGGLGRCLRCDGGGDGEPLFGAAAMTPAASARPAIL